MYMYVAHFIRKVCCLVSNVCLIMLQLMLTHLGWCKFVCRQHQFAIRATLLSTETLKSRNIYLDAAMQFMRMTGEVMYKLLHQGLPYDL